MTATNLSLSFGSRVILDEVSLTIEPGERVGVVGRNGTGKSTMLRILAGDLAPDEGQVVLSKGSRVGVLHQDPRFSPGQTLREAAEEGFAQLHDLHDQLHGVFERMEGASGAELDRLLARQAELERQIEAAGGYAIDHKVGEVLHGLGFTDSQFSLGVDKLSGGQRARLALARLLLEDPDIILLDEPTNHLDLAGRLWLESFLIDEFRGAVLMIAHDRYLLDRVASRIVEVERGGLVEYPGNYTMFRQLRQDRREGMMRAWEKEQTRFKREAAFIRKYKAGQRAKQARGRESRLNRERAASSLERPLELGTIALSLPRAERTGDIVIACRGLSKAYEAQDGTRRVLFENLDLQIERGQRWGIVGPNGAGKTTLVRTLLGEIAPDAGTVKLGTRLAVGYYQQTQAFLDDELTVVRQIQRLVQKTNPDRVLTELETRNLAGAFLFSGGEQDKEIGVLSGGERSRVVLASLMASARNLLVLDEPTNHLDIPSAERLEQLLRSREQGGAYDGTLVLISHDRALIDGTCDHLLILDGLGGARVFLGNYSQWHERESAQDTSPTRDLPTASEPTPTARQDEARPKNRFSWMPLDQLEERMGELETQAAALDEALGEASTWTDPAKGKELTAQRDAIRDELAELEDEWLHKSA